MLIPVQANNKLVASSVTKAASLSAELFQVEKKKCDLTLAQQAEDEYQETMKKRNAEDRDIVNGFVKRVKKHWAKYGATPPAVSD